MVARNAVVVAALVVLGTGVGAAGDLETQGDPAPALIGAFVPGPPLWRPAAERPRPTVKTTDLDAVVDQCVTDAMAAIDTPGAAVAVIVDGELRYEQGYGVKRRGGADPVDADTQFRIGSVTKMFTAAAVMQQVEAGTVFLDDRVTRFVPELDLRGPWDDDPMTVEHLLTHSTGIPDLSFHPNGRTGSDALSEWVGGLDSVGLHAPPGAFYNYSNPNFNLAGLVVERASGSDYRSYMATNIFAAAGLDDTTFDPAAVAARGNASWGHMDDGAGGETVYAPDEYDNGEYAPAGYAYSTAGDLVRWALLLADGGGGVLSPASAAAMQAPHRDMQIVPGMGYGYGIFVEPFYNLTVRQHGGNIWGWGTYLLWHPQRRFAVAVLANTFSSLPDAAYCIADAVLEPDHSAAPEYPFDPERMALFESTLDASIATGWPTSPYPLMGEVVAQSDEQMLLFLWDPVGGYSDVWMLDHQVLDVFYVDIDQDGSYDLDLSFLISAGTPGQLRWLRMRPLVGSPQRPPRSASR